MRYASASVGVREVTATVTGISELFGCRSLVKSLGSYYKEERKVLYCKRAFRRSSSSYERCLVLIALLLCGKNFCAAWYWCAVSVMQQVSNLYRLSNFVSISTPAFL